MIIKLILAAVFIKLAINNKKRKYLYTSIALLILSFSMIKTFIYQRVFGEETSIYENKPFSVKISPIKNKQTFSYKIGKYKIIYEPQAEIDLYAKVAYIYYNDTIFSSLDYYSNPVYDTISPIDLSVFIGSMAQNMKDYKVEHERRVMIVYGDIVIGEWENIHVIPATRNIRLGFDTVNKGDNISLKGFLINWQGTDFYDYIKMKTALSFESISEEKIAGRVSWLCMQFFVTEMTVNGYIFK